MKHIFAEGAPKAIGPYSHAVITGNLVYASGQGPLDPNSGEIVGANAAEQTEQVIKNLKTVLEAAGSSLEKVVKNNCYLFDMNDFAAFNEVYGKYFSHKPARTTIAAKTLPKNILVEIESIAELA